MIIYKTMKECGLEHDEGPDVGGPVRSVHVQTETPKPFYKKYAELLIAAWPRILLLLRQRRTSEEEDVGGDIMT